VEKERASLTIVYVDFTDNDDDDDHIEVSIDELRALINGGKVLPATRIWTEGMEEWQCYSEVDSFLQTLPEEKGASESAVLEIKAKAEAARVAASAAEATLAKLKAVKERRIRFDIASTVDSPKTASKNCQEPEPELNSSVVGTMQARKLSLDARRKLANEKVVVEGKGGSIPNEKLALMKAKRQANSQAKAKVNDMQKKRKPSAVGVQVEDDADVVTRAARIHEDRAKQKAATMEVEAQTAIEAGMRLHKEFIRLRQEEKQAAFDIEQAVKLCQAKRKATGKIIEGVPPG
jgi:hypothetical protein